MSWNHLLDCGVMPCRWLLSCKANALSPKTAVCESDAQSHCCQSALSGYPDDDHPQKRFTQFKKDTCQ